MKIKVNFIGSSQCNINKENMSKMDYQDGLQIQVETFFRGINFKMSVPWFVFQLKSIKQQAITIHQASDLRASAAYLIATLDNANVNESICVMKC